MTVNNSEQTKEIVCFGNNEGKAYADTVLPKEDDRQDNAGGEFIHSFISNAVIVVKI